MSTHTFSTSIAIDAAPERVWPIMRDVVRWHTWTSTITSIQLLGGKAFAIGTRALVRQPKLPPAMWTVTELNEGRNFTWASSAPGMRSTARHVIEPHAGGTRVTLSIEYSGLLGGLLARIFADITDRYLRIEAESLKRTVELGAPIAVGSA